MNFKKRVNGSWTDTSHYIHNTSTDAITTLPTVIYPTDTTATVGLKGQTLQSSIPSPTSPVMPQGTGERTGNLFDIKDGTQTINNVVWTAYHGSITAHGTTTAASESDGIIVYDGTFTRSGNYINYCRIQASKSIKPPAGTYTFSANANPSDSSRIALIVGDNDTYFANQTARKIAVGETFSVNGNEYVMLVVSSYTALNQYDFADIMLNEGSTALPYEPWGYKIPILNNSQTTNVYLGEVETTRQIKKLVLTGQERIFANPSISASYAYYFDAVPNYKQNLKLGYCTHYPNVTNASSAEGLYMGGSINLLTKFSDGYDTVDKFKTYLQQQYAAGTPVTVWYILATPTTGIVNEPLRKIGDYADEVSGITIPTIAGTNTLSVDTTLQPSEVSVNYKGWHPVADVHKRESGAWT